MQNYEIISEFFALATRKWRRRGAARATNVKNGNKIASKQRFCDIFRSKDVHEERKAKNMPKNRRTGREPEAGVCNKACMSPSKSAMREKPFCILSSLNNMGIRKNDVVCFL